MITPHFSCSQTETEVVVKMYCPSVRVCLLDCVNGSLSLLMKPEVGIRRRDQH